MQSRNRPKKNVHVGFIAGGLYGGLTERLL